MATRTGRSGTYNISTANSYISGYVQWTETYDDSTYISTNKTTVTQVAYLHRTNTYSGTTSITNISGQRTAYFGSDTVTDTSNITLSIAGSSSSSGGPYTEVYRASKEIQHDSDGGKNLDLGFYMTNSASGAGGNAFKVSKTTSNVTLTTIPRQATLTSAPDFTDEENPTIKYSNPAGNSASGLVAGIFNTSGTVAYVSYRDVNKTGTLSYTFNLTSAERTALRNACTGNSMQVKFYLRTYVGGSYYYSSIQKTMTIVNGNPTFSNFTFADTNSTTVALTGNNQNVIKGYSNVTATISTANKATANKGATMSKYRFSCGTNTPIDIGYSSSSSVSGTINKVTDGIFTMYAIDSRGNSKSAVKQANSIIGYSNITKGNIGASRSNGISTETTLSFNGTWWNNSFRDGLIKSLSVGDVLSKTKLKLNFSNLTYADVYNAGIPGYTVLAKSSNGYQIELSITSDPRMGDSASVDMIYVENDVRNQIDTLWYSYSDGTVDTNLTEYDLSSGFGTPTFARPADFGTLIQVDSSCLIYSMVKFENTINNTLSVAYKYKKSSDSNWTNGTTPLTLTVNNNNFSFSGLIAGDEGANGFNINYSYDIQVIVTDELSSVTFTVQLSSGIPHIAYAQNGVGIMGKYDASVGGLLQVGGNRIDRPSFEIKTLFSGGVETSNCVTDVGAVATLSESFRNFDLIFIRIGTRIWTWSSKYEMLLASKINIGTGSNVRFVIPYSCYQGGTIYTIELGFTSETTLQIYYNSCVNTSGNGGYISEIYGVKLKAF